MAVKTKDALIEALLELLEDNELEKITVTDLVEKCDISRQTFYYHFEDLTQLYAWVFKSETTTILSKIVTNEDWAKVICHYVKFLKKYSILIKRAVDSVYSSYIFKLLYDSAIELFTYFFDAHSELKTRYKGNLEFDIHYHSHACASMIMTMVHQEESEFERLAINTSKYLYNSIKSNIE